MDRCRFCLRLPDPVTGWCRNSKVCTTWPEDAHYHETDGYDDRVSGMEDDGRRGLFD